MTRLIFLDTETTGLNRRTRKIWDLAYIVRDRDHGPQRDVENQWFISVGLEDADPFSLKLGHYYERHLDPFGSADYIHSDRVMSEWRTSQRVASDFRDAILVGAVPSFDEETLANLLLDNGLTPTWHYHLVDVETLAAGALKWQPRWNFDKLLAEYGLTYAEEDRHTALGDARMVRDLYDAVLKAQQ